MAFAQLDDGVGTESLGIEVAVKGVPDGEGLIIGGHLQFIADVRDNDGDGLIVDIADVIAILDGWDDVASVDISDIGSCAVAVDRVQDIADLIVRDDDAASLWI